MREVPGRARLSAFTLNHRFSEPGMPAPYVVAEVALVEDPRARLTTNIVGCAPDDLRIGDLMVVAFERHDDVWLPLFTLSPEQAGDSESPKAQDEIDPKRVVDLSVRWFV